MHLQILLQSVRNNFNGWNFQHLGAVDLSKLAINWLAWSRVRVTPRFVGRKAAASRTNSISLRSLTTSPITVTAGAENLASRHDLGDRRQRSFDRLLLAGGAPAHHGDGRIRGHAVAIS